MPNPFEEMTRQEADLALVQALLALELIALTDPTSPVMKFLKHDVIRIAKDKLERLHLEMIEE